MKKPAMMEDEYSEEYLRLVRDWLREYVSAADRRVGRSGPVCPFVPRALAEHAVDIRMRYDIDGSNEAELNEELRAEIRAFGEAERPPHGSGVLLESRLIVMPRMGRPDWSRLDAVYAHLKNFAVESGLMVGQFHPLCDERAVRNADFRVSVAPVAMLAIRHMAPHDILFLHDSGQWFKEYDMRFGSHFQRGRIRDSLLLSMYREARERHGLPT
jgi:heptaprenyl diphosphate synthase